MGLIRWFTKNWADTREATHSDLRPLVLALPLEEAIERVKQVVAGMPRWKVEGSPSTTGLHLTRTTRTMRFVDDVVLHFHADAAGTIIHARSKSRVGVGDLGQNRRNVQELWKRLAM